MKAGPRLIGRVRDCVIWPQAKKHELDLAKHLDVIIKKGRSYFILSANESSTNDTGIKILMAIFYAYIKYGNIIRNLQAFKKKLKNHC